MTKEDIALELTLKLLDNFKYDFSDYGGTTPLEHAEHDSEIASTLYNNIYKELLKNS
ncbi:hypothetical protein [Clostridium gasigenes]|uniref:hypothetical protein n=1 Tax=Clostridium gasigenes TaxID=94869 RepID=UPI001587688D|nr:hypothetical protein [Clostridium gasigenes]